MRTFNSIQLSVMTARHKMQFICKILIISLFVVTLNCECVSKIFNDTFAFACQDEDCFPMHLDCFEGNHFSSMTKVIFGNGIESFQKDAFRNLPKLHEIRAVRGKLSTIVPGAFKNLTSLKSVLLAENAIEEIKFEVFNLIPSLERLDLKSNKISQIQNGSFANLENLRDLHLDHNYLITIKSGWFTNTKHIQKLTVSYNKLAEIVPNTFENFLNLKYLDLKRNQLSEIGYQAFKGLNNLEELNLKANNILKISSDAFDRQATIDFLHLGTNRLSFLTRDVLNKIAIHKLILHPNPWQCPCLNHIMQWSLGFQVKIGVKVACNPWEDSHSVCAYNKIDPAICSYEYDRQFYDTQSEYFKNTNYDELSVNVTYC